MEVFQTNDFYIFAQNEKSLWWNRSSSEFLIKAGWDLSSVDDIECLGYTSGIIGIISLPGILDPHLMVIRESVPVAAIYPPHIVYKIKGICILSNDEPDQCLSPCFKHKGKVKPGLTTKNRLFDSSQLVNKTWSAVKIASSTIKTTTQQAAALATSQIKTKRPVKNHRKIEKQILDEIHKIFDDSNSFYYCPNADFTNNLQRRDSLELDDRFFWNKHMLKDIIEMKDDSFVLPIIQGFVQIEHCVIGNDEFSLALVSRRSRFRAGTRYKRRGIDENGHVANYVETEQILSFGDHQMSFYQLRGSVPVYWSQPGYKYRPPPRIDRDEKETQFAFAKHFDSELKLYKSMIIINLVEQYGKEEIIFEAYGNHIVQYNSNNLIYVTFDFHEYCRGMRFENVSALVEALAPEVARMSFHWRDAKGPICNQNAVFRVNCMDCLDRTNVVQTAMGRAVLESQLVKVGLMPPYSQVPDQLKIPFMLLWANNGDIISKQYAGTNALKGDYTRTGERNFAGLFKDGMNSANRYYLARFKDTFRQDTIDVMLGNPVSAESLLAMNGNNVAEDDSEATEHARQLVEDCRRMLLGLNELPIGSWGLINADPDTGDASETEVDMILLLTADCYLVAEYDSNFDKIVHFEKVLLQNIIEIELGLYQHPKIFQMTPKPQLCLRFNYSSDGINHFYHMLRSASLRFFNNVAVVIKTQEEITESLTAILECFRKALQSCGNTNCIITTEGHLKRRKNRFQNLEIAGGMKRDLSESQFVQTGSKAVSNAAEKISRIGQTFSPKILTGKKAADPSSSSIYTNPDVTKTLEQNETRVRVGTEMNDIVKQANVCNDNSFLQSVGIIMVDAGELVETKITAKPRSSALKKLENVSRMSITSVIDNVTMPPELLNNIPENTITPATPGINVEKSESEERSNIKVCRSVADIYISDSVFADDGSSLSAYRDLKLNLPSSQSENALKQLKTLASPLTKLAANIATNLDPRKYGSKTSVNETSPDLDKDKLLEKWEATKCKTKLISL